MDDFDRRERYQYSPPLYCHSTCTFPFHFLSQASQLISLSCIDARSFNRSSTLPHPFSLPRLAFFPRGHFSTYRFSRSLYQSHYLTGQSRQLHSKVPEIPHDSDGWKLQFNQEGYQSNVSCLSYSPFGVTPLMMLCSVNRPEFVELDLAISKYKASNSANFFDNAGSSIDGFLASAYVIPHVYVSLPYSAVRGRC